MVRFSGTFDFSQFLVLLVVWDFGRIKVSGKGGGRRGETCTHVGGETGEMGREDEERERDTHVKAEKQ